MAECATGDEEFTQQGRVMGGGREAENEASVGRGETRGEQGGASAPRRARRRTGSVRGHRAGDCRPFRSLYRVAAHEHEHAGVSLTPPATEPLL